jgi:hypothetical protein
MTLNSRDQLGIQCPQRICPWNLKNCSLLAGFIIHKLLMIYDRCSLHLGAV